MGKTRAQRVARRIQRDQNVRYTTALVTVQDALREHAEELARAEGDPDDALFRIVLREWSF